jgi:hypothetical protein
VHDLTEGVEVLANAHGPTAHLTSVTGVGQKNLNVRTVRITPLSSNARELFGFAFGWPVRHLEGYQGRWWSHSRAATGFDVRPGRAYNLLVTLSSHHGRNSRLKSPSNRRVG